MDIYDFKDSDTLDEIATKIFLAKEALQMAKAAATRKKSTTFLQERIQGKIDALETREKALQENNNGSQNVEENDKNTGSA